MLLKVGPKKNVVIKMKHVCVLFELFIGVYGNGDALLHAGKLAASTGNEHKSSHRMKNVLSYW